MYELFCEVPAMAAADALIASLQGVKLSAGSGDPMVGVLDLITSLSSPSQFGCVAQTASLSGDHVYGPMQPCDALLECHIV